MVPREDVVLRRAAGPRRHLPARRHQLQRRPGRDRLLRPPHRRHDDHARRGHGPAGDGHQRARAAVPGQRRARRRGVGPARREDPGGDRVGRARAVRGAGRGAPALARPPHLPGVARLPASAATSARSPSASPTSRRWWRSRSRCCAPCTSRCPLVDALATLPIVFLVAVLPISVQGLGHHAGRHGVFLRALRARQPQGGGGGGHRRQPAGTGDRARVPGHAGRRLPEEPRRPRAV